MMKGRNDRAIATIAESITVTVDTVKAMEQQEAADKAAQAELAFKMAKNDKSMQVPLQSLKIMHQMLAAETRFRDADEEFGEKCIKPITVVETPQTHTLVYHMPACVSDDDHPRRHIVVAWPTPIWPVLSLAMAEVTQPAKKINRVSNIDKDIDKKFFSQSYAEALKIKGDFRQSYSEALKIE